MRKSLDMLNGNIAKLILLFFIPILCGSLFQQLYNTVDAIVVGNFVGKEALAAVGGSTGTVINLFVGFVTGLASGATVVIAQYYGKQEIEGVQKGVYSSMFLAIVLGAFLTVFGYWFTPQILELLNVPNDIIDLSILYMRIYMIGMIPSLIYNNGAGILRAVGDSKRPLYFLIASCITNIVLDIVFVVIFHLGVAGVAIATTISQIVSCILTLYVLAKTEESYSFHLTKLYFEKNILIRIIEIGFPVGIQSCLYSVANLCIQSSINSYGTDTVAAWAAFGKIDAMFWNASGALGQAVLTFCGQNFGAGQIDRVKKGIHVGVLIYMIGAAGISAICYFGGNLLYHLFTQDATVIQIGLDVLQFTCPFWITFCFVEILASSIRACGDSFVPMIITALGIGAFRICWIFFYASNTLFDTIVCYPISWVMTSILFVIYYLQGGWLKKSLKQREKILKNS